MEIIVDNIDATLVYSEEDKHLKKVITDALHVGIGIKNPEAQFVKAYQIGAWDGYIDFYDESKGTFPMGLVDQVVTILEHLQNKYSFQFKVIDNRPDVFLTVEDMDKSIELTDKEIGSITLRDYQYNSVKESIDNQIGIVHVATNGGKCLHYHTRLGTPQGYSTIQDIFEELGLDATQPECSIPNTFGLELINRYGHPEKPSHITINGEKTLLDISTSEGNSVRVTENNPVLVNRNGVQEWVQAEDLILGDTIYVQYKHDTPRSKEYLNVRDAFKLGVDYGPGRCVGHEVPYPHVATGAKEIETIKQLRIPKAIWRGSDTIKLAFISGFISEGTSTFKENGDLQIDGASKQVLKQVQLLLQQLGYRTILIEHELPSELDGWYGSLVIPNKVALMFTRNLSTESNYVNDERYVDITEQWLQPTKIVAITNIGKHLTYDVCMPETNSLLADGIVVHNTEIASGVIQQIRPYLERGETVAFFTNSSAIFNQSAERISERLGGLPVGKYGNGKKNIKEVNVVMIPTLNSALSVDPEKGLKLSAKEQVIKKMAKQVGPNFFKGINQRRLLEVYINNFKVITKADAVLKEELEKVLYSCGSDAQVKMKMKNYEVEYQKIIEKKNGKILKKFNEAKEFLESVAVMIVDEAHHTSSDTWYNTLRYCVNARYRVALTGSIDKSNKILWQRMQALFGKVTSRTSNQELIDLGHSAKPTITMVPIRAPRDIQHLSIYMEVYRAGIVENEYRNKIIAGVTAKKFQEGKGVLIIVNYTEHGDILSDMLRELKVDHFFMHGELPVADREAQFNKMRNGELKVMISTSLIDEGVDISGIDVLILGAGGKSLRQVLQRIGRALRKKKGENVATIFDFVDYTNPMLLKHSKERRKINEAEGFEIKDLDV